MASVAIGLGSPSSTGCGSLTPRSYRAATTSTNTNASTIMIAEKGAAMIKATARRKSGGVAGGGYVRRRRRTRRRGRATWRVSPALGLLSKITRNAAGFARITLLLAGLTVAGCSVQQLHDNTIDIGGSVGSIYTAQVLENINALANDSNAMPSHYSISGGQITSRNSVSPSISVPLGSQVTRTVVTNGVSQIVSPYNSVQLAASEEWTQLSNITPERNADKLRVLREAYLFVIGKYNSVNNFKESLTPQFTNSSDTEKIEQGKPSTSMKTTTTRLLADPKLVESIIKKCLNAPKNQCFKILKNPTCWQSTESGIDQGEWTLDHNETWICLGKYRSYYSKLFQKNEMVVYRNAYNNGVLFDLVLLSLQLQQSAPAPDKKS
jgi:hypothetical protein